MAIRYKKFEARTGEVVEPTRIRDNMQSLGHELNGNIDRDNLPEKGITSTSIADESFNLIKNYAVRILTPLGATNIDLKDKPIHYFDLPDVSLTADIPVDCVVVAHFGAWFQWGLLAAIDETLVNGSSINTNWSNNYYLGDQHYEEAQEHFIDFRLLVNGESICESFSFSFLRESQSVYLTGAIPVSAGKVELKVQARLYRDNLGKREAIRSFKCIIKDRNLILHAKKR